VLRALARLPDAAAGLLLVAVTILLFLQTAFRYVLFVPIGWAEEGARFGLIWLTFLGAAVCCHRRLHSRFGLFADRARPRLRRWLAALADLVTLAFGVVMVVKGWEIVERTRYERWIMLDLPVSYGYLAIPVSGCLILLFTAAHLVRDFRAGGS
jgi:TRAP-type C4-dicarboxylate transport system permease small subunit